MTSFGAVDPRYAALHARASGVLGADPRVVRVEVTGSVADGTADAWSDLDLKVIVRDADVGAFLDEWEQWLAKITPTVLADRTIAPFIINTVTDDGLTFDLSVWAESAPEWTPPPGFTVGFMSGRRFDSYGPALAYAVQERLRGLAGPGIRLLKRGDFVWGMTGLGHTLGLLMTVLLAETDVVPADARHPERYLTDEQRAVFASLPPVAANYDAMLRYELALAEATITRARPLFERYELEWPRALEAVAARNVREHLGVTLDWLRDE
ncbi:MAG TPA: nucleotidyltransferase domain-containing protein [Acidimicrobiales bacterium]|nr:nucleotidyltransferase domain-containing protein [Acidimicrobiales bacterium]